MGQHAVFSPSAAHRWLRCPGSLALNAQESEQSSIYADEGTAAHILAKRALDHNRPAEFFIGERITVNASREFVVDEAMADAVQLYLDEVNRLALGQWLLTEQEIDLSETFCVADQFGTADAVVYNVKGESIAVVDLKYGTGERVSAGSPEEPNEQLAIYALGAMRAVSLIGPVQNILLEIVQPRLNHVDFCLLSIDQLLAFKARLDAGVTAARKAMSQPLKFLNPGEKQCRWCKVKATCPALAAKVQAEVGSEFDDLALNPEAGEAGADDQILSRHAQAVGLVALWVSAVQAEVHRRVLAGHTIIGKDGQAMKLVEGKAGNRKWANEQQAEAALVGQLADKAYDRSIITPSVADKMLNRKATKELWKDVFEPLITRGRGRATVAEGSDPRPPFTDAAAASEFEDLAT